MWSSYMRMLMGGGVGVGKFSELNKLGNAVLILLNRFPLSKLMTIVIVQWKHIICAYLTMEYFLWNSLKIISSSLEH